MPLWPNNDHLSPGMIIKWTLYCRPEWCCKGDCKEIAQFLLIKPRQSVNLQVGNSATQPSACKLLVLRNPLYCDSTHTYSNDTFGPNIFANGECVRDESGIAEGDCIYVGPDGVASGTTSSIASGIARGTENGIATVNGIARGIENVNAKRHLRWDSESRGASVSQKMFGPNIPPSTVTCHRVNTPSACCHEHVVQKTCNLYRPTEQPNMCGEPPTWRSKRIISCEQGYFSTRLLFRL